MGIWHLAWQPLPSVYECVCEWVNVTSVVKVFEQSVYWKSAVEMQVHLPFTGTPQKASSPLYGVCSMCDVYVEVRKVEYDEANNFGGTVCDCGEFDGLVQSLV